MITKTNHTTFLLTSAFDSPVRDRVYAAMSELSILAKLIRLCRMTLSNSCSSVKDLSESLILCDVTDKTTPYRATSSIFSWRDFYGRRVCIAMTLFSTRVSSFLRMPTTLTSLGVRCEMSPRRLVLSNGILRKWV